jgi:hypothetical protein
VVDKNKRMNIMTNEKCSGAPLTQALFILISLGGKKGRASLTFEYQLLISNACNFKYRPLDVVGGRSLNIKQAPVALLSMMSRYIERVAK